MSPAEERWNHGAPASRRSGLALCPSNIRIRTETCPRADVHEVRSVDIDDQAYMLEGWEQSYLQCEVGRFNSTVIKLDLPDATAFCKTTNRRLIKRFSPPLGETAVGLVMHGSKAAAIQGHSIGPGDVFVMAGGREHELVCKGAFQVTVVSFRNFHLTEESTKRASIGPAILFGSQFQESGQKFTANWPMAHVPLGASDPAILLSTANDIARHFLEMVCDRTDQKRPFDAQRATRVFRDFRQFTLDHLSEYQEIPSLSVATNAIGISLRTLEQACKFVLGVSPKRYLTFLRLHCARRDLRAPLAQESVTTVAFKWDFPHLGRFSSSYRDLFGETPSETRFNSLRRRA